MPNTWLIQIVLVHAPAYMDAVVSTYLTIHVESLSPLHIPVLHSMTSMSNCVHGKGSSSCMHVTSTSCSGSSSCMNYKLQMAAVCDKNERKETKFGSFMQTTET